MSSVSEKAKFDFDYEILRSGRLVASGSISQDDVYWILGNKSVSFKNIPKVRLKGDRKHELVITTENVCDYFKCFQPKIYIDISTGGKRSGTPLFRKLEMGHASLWFLVAGVFFLIAAICQHKRDKRNIGLQHKSG